ncbi:MAG: polyphosphate kinase 2 family protein [Candidatus Obscuribacterales bacterium]|nr:polyphosphate kinase 2 family protein [Candidatus Obscuribacterales bacterium]
MKRKRVLDRIEPFISPYRVTSGKKFRLADIDPGDTHGLKSESKAEAKEMLRRGVEWLEELQDKLYANDHWGQLVIFQAMDAAGKDSTIKHVMSGVNPQGCQVFSFKQPSPEELDHDYMWRYSKCMPERGRIGIFNRSYYEEVLVVRVHQELLKNEKIPKRLITKNIFEHRLEFIRAYEDYLSQNGINVVKFFLHVSKDEQERRFRERLTRPEKNWKFSNHDLQERSNWKAYMNAYEEAIRATATANAPWYVVPADNKWFTRLIVAGAIVQSLENLDLSYPVIDKQQMADLQRAKEELIGLS